MENLETPGDMSDVPSEIASLIDRAAERWPDRPALIAPETVLTFGDLIGRIRAVTAELTARGIGPGERVACMVRHDVDDVVVMAALMYAGACFVPLDPAVPHERFEFIVADAGCRHLVARPEDSAGRLGAPEHVHDLRAVASATPPTQPVTVQRVDPASTAYVIFTSGSTGRPKGVPVSSGALARHSHAVASAYGLTENDRTLQFASLGFDVAQEEVWASWAAGGALVLNPAGVEGFEQLVRYTCDTGVTVLQLPTAFWRTLIAEPSVRADRLAAVRLVIIGSEAAWRTDLLSWVDSPLAHARLINAYGPTEGVVSATAFAFAPGDQLPPGPGVPIGRALPGRSLWVLTEDGLSLEPGTQGTLLISGILADGYLGRPELQQQRFPREVSGETGPFYDTGDQVRVLPSGDLEFVGRTDSQVKVRGYRIELEEIDAALVALETVHVAGSTVIERAHGEPVLGALVVPSGSVADEETETVLDSISVALQQVLPAYMIPTRLALTTTLPVTVNGKIDRARISALLTAHDDPDGSTAAGSADRDGSVEESPAADAPSDPGLSDAGAALLPLWQQVLGRPSVRADDDFFACGGDSLLAMQFSARARAAGWTVSPREVLTQRTLRRVAETAVASEAGPDGARAPLALLPAQQRWLYDGDLPDMGYFALAALFDVPAAFENEHVIEVAAELLRQHDALRTRLRLLSGEAVVLDGATPPARAVEHVEVGRIDPETVRALSVERQSRLSPGAGRVFRLVHVTDPQGGRRLLVLAHHLVLDGWSMALLVDDLDLLVRQVLRGEPAKLPAASASPGDLASRCAALLTDDRLAGYAEAWRRLPWSDLARLPQDHHGEGRLPSLTFAESTLSSSSTAALLDSARPRLVDLITAAILTALSEWSGHAVHGIDVYTHNRDSEVLDLDLSRTIGYIQATVPIVREVRGTHPSDLVALAASVSDQTPPPFSFDLLRFAGAGHPDSATLAALPRPTARLNYRGHLDRLERRDPDSPLQAAPESTGPNRAPTQAERYQLMFEGDIIDGELVVALKYSTDHYEPATAQALTDSVVDLLRKLVSERP